jgi:3-oxoacyl-[acyl-carrier-protein] synthase II
VERRAVITGAGLISSLGDRPELLYSALCEGRTCLRHLEEFAVNGSGCHLGGRIYNFRPELYLKGRPLRPLDRTSQLAAAAAALALADSGCTAERSAATEVGLTLGTMFGGVHTIAEFDRAQLTSGPASASPMAFSNTVINAPAGQAAIWHGLRGVNTTIAVGSISGLAAIGQAADLVRFRKVDAILAGGVDEFCFESFHGFSQAGLLCQGGLELEFPIPFDRRRNGFALGEGAAFLMLEDRESAESRGAAVLGQLEGHGNAFDCSCGRDPEFATRAIVMAMRHALLRSGLKPGDVDFVSASANGSVLQDYYEGRALKEVFTDRAEELPVTAIKGSTGESLGASGPFQVIAGIETLRHGTLPGIPRLQELPFEFPLGGVTPVSRRIRAQRALVNAVGLDGNVCSLVIAAANN